jgi:replicative DNA helicase
MTPHPDDWLRHVTPEVPTRAELDAAGAVLHAEIEVWRAEQARAAQAQLAEAAALGAIVTGSEAIAEYLDEIRADRAPAIYTGWRDVDEQLGRPITAGELVLIVARPGVGKTWALQAWIEKTLQSDPAAAASLLEMEMLPWHMGERLAAHALGSSPSEVGRIARASKITVEQIVEAQPSVERLAIHPRSLTVMQLPQAIAAAEARLGRRPTILAVDYMGLLGWSGHASASTYQRASDNARALKEIARSEGVVILAAAQLSRAAGTGSQKPSLDAIRDSGVIEEAADRILGMWREAAIEDADKPAKPEGELNITVMKNRHGRSSGKDFPLRFDEALRLVEPGLEVQETFPWDDRG